MKDDDGIRPYPKRHAIWKSQPGVSNKAAELFMANIWKLFQNLIRFGNPRFWETLKMGEQRFGRPKTVDIRL